MIKLLSATPCPRRFFRCFRKGSAQSPASTFSNSPYSFRNCNSHATSTTTKKTEKPKITIDDKVTFRYPPVPYSSTAAPNYDFSRSPGSSVSNSLYSLRNCNQYFKIASNNKKTEKTRKLMIKLLSTTPLPPKIFKCFPKGFHTIPYL